jgi:hypothetical protein
MPMGFFSRVQKIWNCGRNVWYAASELMTIDWLISNIIIFHLDRLSAWSFGRVLVDPPLEINIAEWRI